MWGWVPPMLVHTLAGTIIVSLLTMLVLLLRQVNSVTRVTGWGFLRLKALCWIKSAKSCFFLSEWKLENIGEVGLEFYNFLHTTQLGICVMGMALHFDRVQLRFVLSFDSLNFLISPTSKSSETVVIPPPASPTITATTTTTTTTSQKRFNRVPELFLRLLILVGSLWLFIFKIFFTIDIGRVNFIFTQFPKSISDSELEYWTALQVSLHNVSLLDRDRFLKASKIIGSQVVIDERKKAVIEIFKVLDLPNLCLWRRRNPTNPASPAPTIDYRMTSGGLTLHLWPITLLLITSAVSEILGQKGEKNNTPGNLDFALPSKNNESSIFKILELLFPSLGQHLLSLLLGNVSIHLHLPVSNWESHRFEELIVDILDFSCFSCAEEGLRSTPKCLVTGQRATVSSIGANKVGPQIQSVIQRLFGNDPNGIREELLILEEIVIGNCWLGGSLPEDFDLKDSTVAEWISQLLNGQAIWSIDRDQVDPFYTTTINKVKGIGSNLFEMVSKGGKQQPFDQGDFTILPRTILAQMKRVAFEVPFEYPLSNLFEHLSFFIKTSQAPLSKVSDRQDFNLFCHTWRLLVLTFKAQFSIADDEFESRLQRSFRYKRMLWSKMARLERLFWKQCQRERERIEREYKRENFDHWVPPALLVLVKASEQPEIFKSNPYLARKYFALQEKLFEIFKLYMREDGNGDTLAGIKSATTSSSIDRGVGKSQDFVPKPLLAVSANSLAFGLRWNREFIVGGMSSLLNIMEGGESFQEEDVREFGLFLGGFIDVSAQDLAVTLRDYAVPICYARKARLVGLIFLIEEPSYPSAKAKQRVSTHRDRWPGRWNLMGLDKVGAAMITRTILPIKIYHSLQLSAFTDGQPVLGGFSPLFEGAFQMLDRAFELFSKPSEELSPPLPFWDKLRLLLRGTSSSLIVQGPCRVVGLAGTDLHGTDESLSLVFPSGFAVGLTAGAIRIRVPQAIAYLNSEREALLRWLHRTTGTSFSLADAKILGVPRHLAGQLPIIAFPRVAFTVSFEMIGRDGSCPVPHNSVKICALGAVEHQEDRKLFHQEESIGKSNLAMSDLGYLKAPVQLKEMVQHEEPEFPTLTNTKKSTNPKLAQVEQLTRDNFCPSPGPSNSSTGRFDAYCYFRLHSLSISISVDAAAREESSLEHIKHEDTRKDSLEIANSRILLFYYRELESWFAWGFGRFVTPPVKPGKLFQFGPLSKSVTPKIATVMKEVKFSLAYEGFFCVRGLQYYAPGAYGGLLLSSCGRTRLTLAWRQSDLRSSTNPNYGRWFQHFAEVDFAKMRLAVLAPISSDPNGKNRDSPLQSQNLPFTYSGVSIMDVLTAPRLFYIAVDQGCFKRDPEASAAQRRVIEIRLHQLSQEIDLLALKLRQCDPTKDMEKFAIIRRDLGVLLEQNDYISSFLFPLKGEKADGEGEGEGEGEEGEEGERDQVLEQPMVKMSTPGTSKKVEKQHLISNHQFIIQNAQLLWHRGARDIIFALVDQQFQFFRCSRGLKASALRKLGGVFVAGDDHKVINSEGLRNPSQFPPNSPAVSQATSPTSAIFEALMTANSPLDVGPEPAAETKEAGGGTERDNLMGDPMELCDAGIWISLCVDVTLINPQIILISEPGKSSRLNNSGRDKEKVGEMMMAQKSEDSKTKGSKTGGGGGGGFKTESEMGAAIIITAQNASLKYGTIRAEEFGPVAGRRTKVVLEQALVHTAFRSNFAPDQWPPLYPVEYLLTQETEASRFIRTSEKLRATFVYDVASQRFSYKGAHHSLRRVFGEGDTLRVDADKLILLTNSAQYCVLYDVIVDLLVYRDPTQKMRHEQLEAIILASGIFHNQMGLLPIVKRMQTTIIQALKSVTARLSRALDRGQLISSCLDISYARLKSRWDELALVVDALWTVTENREKLRQRQTRLLLDVLIGKIQWTLCQERTGKIDGKILTEMALENIHDSWLSAADGTQSNLVEIGGVRATNRLPGAFYRTLVAPVPMDLRTLLSAEGRGFRGIGTQGNAIRFFFKARPPVSGILIIEHAELNLTPLQIQLTYDIAEELIKFFFPELPHPPPGDGGEDGGSASTNSNTFKTTSIASTSKADPNRKKVDTTTVPSKTLRSTNSSSGGSLGGGEAMMIDDDNGLLAGITTSIRSTAASFFSKVSSDHRVDDVDMILMKERSSENCSFIYVNVPASQHLISYKGRGETSITDVENFILRLPDFEYHSQLWSWLEFTLQLRRDAVRTLVSNIGALVKDKIRRLGQANVPEGEDDEGSTMNVLTRTASRIGYTPRPVEDPNSKEAQERKAKMVLGKSYHPKH